MKNRGNHIVLKSPYWHVVAHELALKLIVATLESRCRWCFQTCFYLHRREEIPS